jgi:hypothetical protein
MWRLILARMVIGALLAGISLACSWVLWLAARPM